MLCHAATHGRTQLHAVAERLSISFGDNNWVCSPVSETPCLEPAVEAMCLWQTFVSGQCVRNAMIVAKIPRVSPSRPTETGAGPSDARIAAAASHFREHGLHGAWVMVSVRIVDPLSGTRAGS